MTKPVFVVPKSTFFPLYHATSHSKVLESHSLLASRRSKGFLFLILFIITLAVLGLGYCVGFSLVVVSGVCPPAAVHRLIATRLLLWRSSTVAVHGLAAPWHVRSSQFRGQTHIFCIGRWILYHWATREALHPPQISVWMELFIFLGQMPRSTIARLLG